MSGNIHDKIISWLYLLFGIFVFTAGWVVLLGHYLSAPPSARTLEQLSAPLVLGLGVSAAGALIAISAYFFRRGFFWAQGGVLFGALWLGRAFPIGTAIALYTVWFLLLRFVARKRSAVASDASPSARVVQSGTEA